MARLWQFFHGRRYNWLWVRHACAPQCPSRTGEDHCSGTCAQIKTGGQAATAAFPLLDHEACHACAYEDSGQCGYLYTWAGTRRVTARGQHIMSYPVAVDGCARVSLHHSIDVKQATLEARRGFKRRVPSGGVRSSGRPRASFWLTAQSFASSSPACAIANTIRRNTPATRSTTTVGTPADDRHERSGTASG